MKCRLAPLLLAVIVAGGPASAGQVDGRVAENPARVEEATEMPDLAARRIVGHGMPRVERDETARALARDGKAGLEMLAIRSHSRDGSERSRPPGEAVREAFESLRAKAGGTVAPGAGQSAADRQVFGDDDRVRVTGTTDFPFSVIGQIWIRKAGDGWGTCTGTLIGRRTVVTAAHCLYDHDNGGWQADYEFFPGMNGYDDAPYGRFRFKDVHILEGYVAGYAGDYGSVVPWDLGVLVLDEPAGERIGRMGYAAYDPPWAFTANVVGYPGDKPTGTMWRTDCEVDPANADTTNFAYLCDTYPGSSGSAVFERDPDDGGPRIVGIAIAESPIANLAISLNPAYFEWLRAIAEED